MLKILLIKRGAIGDLLLATPLIRQLKKAYPDCQLDLLVGKSASIAITKNPYLDNVFIRDDSDFALSGCFRFARFLFSLRKQYDNVFILDKHWYFNLMAKIIKARFTIGFSRGWFSACLLDESVPYNDVTRYHSLYYLDLLNASALAFTSYDDIQLDIFIADADKQKVKQLLVTNKIDNYVIVVNSGGNNSYETSGIRMLPASKISALLQKLLTKHKVILLGGKIDANNYNSYLAHLNNPPNLFNWAGQLSFAQSAYLIANSAKFYTTDCGAMHLGVAMLTPRQLCAFFGPTNPSHILPASYLNISAKWSDEDIYDPAYQLKGLLPVKKKEFFRHLDLDKLNCI